MLIRQRNYNNLELAKRIDRFIFNFIIDRIQRVNVDGARSYAAPVISGLIQGSVLGPLLFIILIGETGQNVANAFLSSFDDMSQENCK